MQYSVLVVRTDDCKCAVG